MMLGVRACWADYGKAGFGSMATPSVAVGAEVAEDFGYARLMAALRIQRCRHTNPFCCTRDRLMLTGLDRLILNATIRDRPLPAIAPNASQTK